MTPSFYGTLPTKPIHTNRRFSFSDEDIWHSLSSGPPPDVFNLTTPVRFFCPDSWVISKDELRKRLASLKRAEDSLMEGGSRSRNKRPGDQLRTRLWLRPVLILLNISVVSTAFFMVGHSLFIQKKKQ